MIWFACKKCNKTHNRPETSAGTMIFCDCGLGLTVPWESSAAPPAVSPPTVVTPKVPDLAPIQFDPVTIEGPASSAASSSNSRPALPAREDDEERSYRRGRTEKRDPEFCFNHQRRPKVDACAECGEVFCSDCLVRLQGALLCGPCKNFRARRQELPPAASSVATASLVISLIAGPLMMCLLLASSSDNSAMRVLSYLSLLLQVLALGLGLWALHDAQKVGKAGGQWVAVTGVAASALTCVLMVLLNLFANRLV